MSSEFEKYWRLLFAIVNPLITIRQRSGNEGGGNITSVSRKMIDRIKDSYMKQKPQLYADQIKSGAQAFVDKVNSAGENRNYTLDTLMDKLDEVYREKISKIESIKILNNMKDILRIESKKR